jgi:hypothetical protein
MDGRFQDILNKINRKSGRSRLEPYGELIDELRSRGLTYRGSTRVSRVIAVAHRHRHLTGSFVLALIASALDKENGGGHAGPHYFVEKLCVRRMPDSYSELSDA